MKTHMLLAFTAFSLMSFSMAGADELSYEITGEIQALKAPDPIQSTPTFSYWKRVWSQSTPATTEQLRGSWMVIGQAATIACSYQFNDSYNEKGIKNQDGSNQQVIFNDFPGPRGQKIFGVKFINLGKKKINQGPYSVDNEEPQFSKWGYANGKLTKAAHFENSCRIDSHDPATLICLTSIKLISKPDGGDWTPNTKECAAQAYGTAVIYSRRPSSLAAQ